MANRLLLNDGTSLLLLNDGTSKLLLNDQGGAPAADPSAKMLVMSPFLLIHTLDQGN